MKHDLDCQVCLAKFKGIASFKIHLRSMPHRKKVAEVFQTDIHKGNVSCPHVIWMDPRADIKQTILGLSLVTLCFSQGPSNFFYLCHACEEKCPADTIVGHLSSPDHNSNYFTYTDPDVLTFSWVPSKNLKVIHREQLTKEVNERGSGHLQMLELSQNLLKKLETSTYAEVMHTFSENDKLQKLIEAVKPDRKMIQTYQRDSNRKHPLLGMQHLIECICVGPTKKRHYLCTLCNLTMANRMVIKHVLSFDHIYCYFRAYHPSTLMSRECYNDYNARTAAAILDYAKQTLEIHGNADVKQVSLEPDIFTSVNFAYYAEALKKLESIRKENKESSLITSINSGKRLVASQACKTQSGNNIAPPTVSAGSAVFWYKLRCQDCNKIFETIPKFVNHMSQMAHKRMVQKSFGSGESAHDDDQTGRTPFIALYNFIKERSKQNQPVIGVPLVVTCISTQFKVETMYLCFACEDCFPESCLSQHFDSQKHLILTLLYQNPWRLPFAWEKDVDVEGLKSMAWEEQQKRGTNEMIMKVVDIPYRMFCRLTPSYPQAMTTLQLQHTLLKREVPRCETYSSMQDNDRFPLLGERFLVMFDVCVQRHQSTEVGFLCLLCKRRVSDGECYAHVFSREHVASFLDHFHPGSLNSSTDAETLLDLAKQAARIHPRSHVKKIKLERPIWEPCCYKQAKIILQAAMKKSLEPQIVPEMKLVPRALLKNVYKGHAKDNSQQNSQMTEGPEKPTSQNSTDNVEKTVKKEIGAECTNTCCVKSEGDDSCKENERKRPSSMSEKSQEDPEEMGHCQKRKRLSSEQDASFEELQNQPSSKHKEATTADKGESGKTSHNTAEGKESSNGDPKEADKLWQYVKRKSREPVVGLDELIECYCDQCDPFYLCEGCSLKIPESDIISHVTGAVHQKMYLKKHLPPPGKHQEKDTSFLAAKFEQVNGTGEAQVVDLNEETFNDISEQSFESVIQRVKALQYSLCEPPSTSALSAVQPMDTSVTPHVQLAISSVNDDLQWLKEVKTEIDDSAESEGTPSLVTAAVSLKTQTISKTTQSNEDAKMTQHCQLTGTSITRPAGSRTREDASSVLMPTSETNKTCLLSGSTGNNIKVEIISNTAVATSKMTTTSQSVATSDAIVSTSTKSMTAISKGPARSSNSTSATTRSTAPIVSHKAATSISTTPTKLKETADQCAAPTFGSTAAAPASNTSSKIENGCKKSETMTSVKRDNAKTSTKTVQRQNSGGPNADVAPRRSDSAAPHLTSENNNPLTEPSHVSASKRTSSKRCHKVAASDSIMTTFTKSETAISKGPARSSNSTSATTRSAAPISSCKAATSTSTTPALTPTSSKLRETADKCTAPTFSSTAAATQTAAIPNSTTSSKMENGCKKSEMVTSVKRDDAKTLSVQRQNSGGSNPDSTSAQAQKVGVDQLIIVTSEGKRQTYCQMCGVKLDFSNHLLHSRHQQNYVKLKYPGADNLSSVQFTNLVSSLADADKHCGSKCKRLDVTMTVYKELAQLPVNTAIERLQAMLRERDSPANVSRLQAANSSPHKASTPDDEIGSISKVEGYLAANHSDRSQSLKSSEPGANNLTPEQLHLCETLIKEEPEPVTISSVQDKYMTGHVKREAFESQPAVEVTPAIERPAVKMGKTQGCADLLATDSEHAGRFAQTSDTAEIRHQQERRGPESHDTQKEFGRVQKTSPVEFCTSHLLPAAASVNTEQQNQSRPSQNAERHRAQQALPVISVGLIIRDRSHLSTYLQVKKGDKPAVGLGSVWECRTVKEKPFFLCESCEKMLSLIDICQHMVSVDHWLNYVKKRAPHLLMAFWQLDDMPPDRKLEILEDIVVKNLSKQEWQVDAQVILLNEGWCEHVRTAPFSEGSTIKMVHSVLEPTQNLYFQSVSQPKDQQPEDRQSQQVSLPTEKLSTQALATDQRSENARKSTEKPNLKGAAMVGDLDGIKQRRVSSPLDVAGISSKADSVVSPFPGAGTSHSPQESHRTLSLHTELKPPISQHQGPHFELKVKQEPCSDPPSPCSVSPKISQTISVSPKDECLVPRKRPAVETLVSNSPLLEGPLPAKQARITPPPISHPSTQSDSESTPVATSTHLLPKDNGSNEKDASSLDWEEKLVALVKERKSRLNMSSFKSAPNDAQSTTPCTDNSTESGVDAQTSVGYLSQFNPSPPHYADPNHNPGHIPQPKGHTQADSTGDRQLPINPIITARRDPSKQQFMAGYYTQDHTPVSSISPLATASPSGTPAALYVDGQYRQMAHVTNEQQFPTYLSSQAFTGSPMSDNPAVYTGGLSQQREGHTPGVFYPTQIYPQQEANCFQHSLATQTPVVLVKLENQQQRQCLAWANAAGAYLGAVPYAAPVNGSQMYINLGGYSANTITPTPNSNNAITQTSPHIYLNPSGIHYPPTVHNPQ